MASPTVAACNALNGSHDRVLQNEDAEAGVEIDVSKTFMTLNGASFTTTANGSTVIATGAGPTAAHGVIVPVVQPAIPGNDFTVLGTILAPSNIEFGILTRMAPGGKAVIFGSKLGSTNEPFLSTFGPPDWEPVQPPPARGAAYGYTSGERFNFKVKAKGSQLTAKMWDAAMAEPGDSIAATLSDPALPMGRGIGFYVYSLHGAGTDASVASPPVLESLRVTVP